MNSTSRMTRCAAAGADTRVFAPGSPCGFFAVGITLALAHAFWWLAVVTGAAAGMAAPQSLDSATAHAVLASLGTFPPFIAGFVLTALPRWIRVDSAVLGRNPRLAWTYAAGMILAGVGFRFELRWASAGLVVSAWAWVFLTTRVALAVYQSRAEDRLHAIGVLTAMLWTAAALAIAAFACLTERPALLHASARLALGPGVGVAYAFATHRMTPFLHPPCERCPHAAVLSAVVLSLGLITMRSVGTAMGWTDPAGLREVSFLVYATTGLVLLWTAFQADVRRACRTPMMRHLRRGVLWLIAALWTGSLALLPAAPLHRPGLDSAALHMLTLGFMGTTLLAQVSRIAATQSGASPVVGRHGERLHMLLQFVVFVRVGAAVWPRSAAIALPASLLGWVLLFSFGACVGCGLRF